MMYREFNPKNGPSKRHGIVPVSGQIIQDSRVMIRTLLSMWVAAQVLSLALIAQAGQDEWVQGNRIKVRLGGFQGRSLITMEIGQNGDILVRREEKTHDAVSAVTLLLVNGQALAVTGAHLPSGKELEILDAAGLQVQLVEHLLSRAYPAGPSSVKGHEKMSIRERKEPIRIGTTGAKGYFSAPWSVSGEAKELAPEKIGFELRFSFKPEESKKKTETLTFAGIWHRDGRAPRFDDRLPLQGWQIYLLATRSNESQADYAAVPTDGYPTLGDLRQALQKTP